MEGRPSTRYSRSLRLPGALIAGLPSSLIPILIPTDNHILTVERRSPDPYV